MSRWDLLPRHSAPIRSKYRTHDVEWQRRDLECLLHIWKTCHLIRCTRLDYTNSLDVALSQPTSYTDLREADRIAFSIFFALHLDSPHVYKTGRLVDRREKFFDQTNFAILHPFLYYVLHTKLIMRVPLSLLVNLGKNAFPHTKSDILRDLAVSDSLQVS